MHPAEPLRRDHDLHRRRRSRNWAVFGSLLALALLLFAVTVVRLGPDARNPTWQGNWGEALISWMRGEGQ